jgi:hypothetical protein
MVELMVILPRQLVCADMKRVSIGIRLAIRAKVGDATGPVTLAGRRQTVGKFGVERTIQGVDERHIPDQIRGKGMCAPVKRGTRIAH